MPGLFDIIDTMDIPPLVSQEPEAREETPETPGALVTRVFGADRITPAHPGWWGLWEGAPIEGRPCETGLISEATVCDACRYLCKVNGG